MTLILLAHVAATWMMVGLIWFVQIVHYPLFAHVGEGAFPAYETAHNRLTTWVVGPPMFIEAATAFVLLLAKPEPIPAILVWLGAALVLVIWLSTALLQVPQHDILTRGFAIDAYRFLVLSNWLRTVAWTLRGVCVLMMLGSLVQHP
jgi:hypothetical protein